MFIFIFLNLFLGFLLKVNNRIDFQLLSDTFVWAGIILSLSSFIATAIKSKRFSYVLRYDLFAVGAILIWLSYWPPFFREGSPVFYVFPLYFAFITAFFSLFFAAKGENLSIDVINDLQMLASHKISSPLTAMAVVAVSLAFPKHFMLFPVAVTLLIVRFSLACCLNEG